MLEVEYETPNFKLAVYLTSKQTQDGICTDITTAAQNGTMSLIKIGQWYTIEVPLKIPFNTIQWYLLVIRPTVF